MGIILGIIAGILYYMFKDKYHLEEPLYYFDYFAMTSNIFSSIKTHINVGYFMVQIFIDCQIEDVFVAVIAIVVLEIKY